MERLRMVRAPRTAPGTVPAASAGRHVVGDGLARSYSPAARHSREVRGVIAKRISASVAGRERAALDIGTGQGAFLSALGDAGFNRVYGLDQSLAMLGKAADARKGQLVGGTEGRCRSEGRYSTASLLLVAGIS